MMWYRRSRTSASSAAGRRSVSPGLTRRTRWIARRSYAVAPSTSMPRTTAGLAGGSWANRPAPARSTAHVAPADRTDSRVYESGSSGADASQGAEGRGGLPDQPHPDLVGMAAVSHLLHPHDDALERHRRGARGTDHQRHLA